MRTAVAAQANPRSHPAATSVNQWTPRRTRDAPISAASAPAVSTRSTRQNEPTRGSTTSPSATNRAADPVA